MTKKTSETSQTSRPSQKKPATKIKQVAKAPARVAGAAQPMLTKDRAILALVLNVIVLPGLGTIIAGDTNIGVLQLVLFLVGIPLSFVLIGIPLMIGIWIWALITGIQMVTRS